jgi:transposase
MSKAQLVITAVVLEGRSKSEVARDYDVSRNWSNATRPRGAAAIEPHSRRPRRNPRRRLHLWRTRDRVDVQLRV